MCEDITGLLEHDSYKVEVSTSDKKILFKMLSVIHFLFFQSQILNFILLESESRGFRNLIIKEVYIKLTFMIDMRILNA